MTLTFVQALSMGIGSFFLGWVSGMTIRQIRQGYEMLD